MPAPGVKHCQCALPCNAGSSELAFLHNVSDALGLQSMSAQHPQCRCFLVLGAYEKPREWKWSQPVLILLSVILPTQGSLSALPGWVSELLQLCASRVGHSPKYRQRWMHPGNCDVSNSRLCELL